MHQNVGIDDGDMDAVQAKINNCLVKFVLHQQNNKNDPVILLTGVPIVSQNKFCHIIALKKVLCSEAITRREVVFPDPVGTRKVITMEDIRVQGQIAEISLHVPSKLVDPAKISTQKVLDGEEVIVVGFSQQVSMARHLTRGQVKISREDHFQYDCSSFQNISDGAPVFNGQGELVGIIFENEGVTSALNMDTISRDISKFYEGTQNKDLPEILQCIQDQEMKKFGITTKRRNFGKYNI